VRETGYPFCRIDDFSAAQTPYFRPHRNANRHLPRLARFREVPMTFERAVTGAASFCDQGVRLMAPNEAKAVVHVLKPIKILCS
jgi:hypothetical protein